MGRSTKASGANALVNHGTSMETYGAYDLVQGAIVSIIPLMGATTRTGALSMASVVSDTAIQPETPSFVHERERVCGRVHKHVRSHH